MNQLKSRDGNDVSPAQIVRNLLTSVTEQAERMDELDDSDLEVIADQLRAVLGTFFDSLEDEEDENAGDMIS